jgi:DNA-binding CsgD family transcriptional regulator
VVPWRDGGGRRKSIRETARHFEMSEATVKRYSAAAGRTAEEKGPLKLSPAELEEVRTARASRSI